MLIYLRCTGSYKKGIGSSRMVIVVHGSSYIQSHELQARYKTSQGAVAFLQDSVHLRKQEASGTRRNAIL